MKIYQLVTTLGYGDAVGNHILALKSAISEMGYKTEILAEYIDKRLEHEGQILAENFEVDKSDIIIYHLATATDLNYKLCKFPCKKILIYHNITPPQFFSPYDKQAEENCANGLTQTRMLADKIDYCMPVSEFNRQDLINMGYKNPSDVIPILIKFEDYLTPPSQEVIEKYKDSPANIVFLGRIAPNKKQEDVILSFYYYKKYYNPDAKLFLVGSYGATDLYKKRLTEFCKILELDDVYFTGHISFDKMLAYYRIADVFLCMSEHEGFCVPLVEAMYFKIPIIAYDSSAVKDTLGGSGILFHNKNHLVIAGMINKVMTDVSFKNTVINQEQIRLNAFQPDVIKKQFAIKLNAFINCNSLGK